MAFPPRLGLNCLTRVLVSALLCWMDGCQHDSVTHSPLCVSLCLDVYYLFLHSSSSTTFTAFNYLTVLVFLSVSVLYFFVFLCLSRCLSSLIASLRFSYFPLVAFFLQSIVCQSNMWQVVWVKSKSEEGEKSTLPLSLFVAVKKKTQKTSITSMIEWC